MRCKPGDLAYLAKAELPENVGMVVEVLKPARPGYWWVRPLSGPRLTTDGTVGAKAIAADSALRPLMPARQAAPRGGPEQRQAALRF